MSDKSIDAAMRPSRDGFGFAEILRLSELMDLLSYDLNVLCESQIRFRSGLRMHFVFVAVELSSRRDQSLSHRSPACRRS
jgi:hypothetical protein